MTSVFSYLITMIAGIFWLIRVIISVCYTMGVELGIEPFNLEFEVITLFISLACFILIIKRNLIGALIYFIVNGFYFGDDLIKGITHIINGETAGINYLSLFLSFLGVIIPILIIFDVIFNKDGKNGSADKKTDWFFRNKQYDRKHDERADENQYKF